MTEKSLYEIALGEDFSKLPPVTQKIHCPRPRHVLKGVSETKGAESLFGKFLAQLFKFPDGDEQVEIRVEIERLQDGSERWSRIYPDRTMVSHFSHADPETKSVFEIFGPFRFRTCILPNPTGLHLVLDRAWCFGIPFPRALVPHADAKEIADAGAHCFDVTVSLPFFGRLVHYHGRLEFEEG